MGYTARVGRWVVTLGLLASATTSGGCSHTDQGVVGGGMFGALIGALVGGPRNAAAGAAIGGITGAALGGVAGAAEDRAERREVRQAAAEAAAMRQPPLSHQDIVNLTASGVTDDVIINQIRASGAIYHLNAQDLLNLTNAGVRQPVIREMQASASRPARQYYTAVPAQPVYFVQPAPPPVGFGVTYVRRR